MGDDDADRDNDGDADDDHLVGVLQVVVVMLAVRACFL